MASRGKILIVDDESNARAALSEILHDEGFTTDMAADGFKALGKLEDFHADVILTDLKMPGLDGIAFMEKARVLAPGAVFVVMTAFGTISSAVEAVKKGAENYLTKPLDFEALSAVIERAIEKAKLVQETRQLRDKLKDRNSTRHIVCADPRMAALMELISQVGPTRAHVLLRGEGGTGKELLSEALWAASKRADKPLLRVSCAVLDEQLQDSELFGHEQGAFPGAVTARAGKIAEADGGTLLLEDVDGLGLGTQTKLLRLLGDKGYERVGGTELRRADVRVLATTKKDLRVEVEAGRFREDLYYKLSVMTLDLPPLRERRADIAPLASLFLARFSKENGKAVEGITPDALDLLMASSWPGNVRELENSIEHGTLLCDGTHLDVRHLPESLTKRDAEGGMPRVPGATIESLERYAILKTLEACGGSTSRAAAMLGISTRKIQYKLHEYGPTELTEA